MQPEIKLVISQNNKTIQTVIEPIKTDDFVKTIEHFQGVANATLTKMIEDLGGSGDTIAEEEEDESEPEEDVCTSPKRKKK